MPSSFVVVVRDWPVCVLRSVTFAPVMAAPCGSLTVPVTDPRLVWARTFKGLRQRSRKAVNRDAETDVKRDFILYLRILSVVAGRVAAPRGGRNRRRGFGGPVSPRCLIGY